MFIKIISIISSLTLLSRVLGYLRDLLIAKVIGAGLVSDSFFIAFKLPNLFRRVTAEGALTSAVVPIYSKLREQKNKLLADKYLKSLIWKLVLFLCVIVIVLQIIMPFVVYFLAPGFSDDSDTIDQIIIMTRITIFFMPLVSVVALLGVATNVSGKFWILSSSPIILNVCLILGCFFISDNL